MKTKCRLRSTCTNRQLHCMDCINNEHLTYGSDWSPTDWYCPTMSVAGYTDLTKNPPIWVKFKTGRMVYGVDLGSGRGQTVVVGCNPKGGNWLYKMYKEKQLAEEQ